MRMYFETLSFLKFLDLTYEPLVNILLILKNVFAVLTAYILLPILKHCTVLDKVGHYVGQYYLFLLIIF